MSHDSVAWSLKAGGHRFTYLVHGRIIAMKHEDAPWIVADHMSAQAAHDAAVSSTAAHRDCTILSGPVSLSLTPIAAATLRESGVVTDGASRLVDEALSPI